MATDASFAYNLLVTPTQFALESVEEESKRNPFLHRPADMIDKIRYLQQTYNLIILHPFLDKI